MYGARFIQHLDSSYAGADDSDKGSPVFMLGDAKIEILNYDETYLQTKVPDANYFSYGVKITAANGRTAFLAGDINNYTDGDGNGVGDEDRLKDVVGPVDLLKLGHHGAAGSNSSDYLRAILKQANGDDRCVVVQTGDFAALARRVIDILDEKGARYFSAPEMPGKGEDALVADLTADGVWTNAEDADPVVREFSVTPYATLYLNGVPYKGTGWHTAKSGKQYFFGEPGVDEGSCDAVTNRWTTLDGVKVYIEENAEIIKYPHNDDVEPDIPSVDSNKRGWHKVGSDWVYYDSRGVLTTGWLNVGQTWYYLRDSGIMATGWVSVSGSDYYFDGSGAMPNGLAQAKRPLVLSRSVRRHVHRLARRPWLLVLPARIRHHGYGVGAGSGCLVSHERFWCHAHWLAISVWHVVFLPEFRRHAHGAGYTITALGITWKTLGLWLPAGRR